MDSAQHIVKLGADGTLTAVELVDRTMIELSLQNPAFAATVRTALISSPDAVLLVEFAGADKTALLRKLKDLEAADGRPGPARLGRADARRDAAEGLWEVRKAGLNIMMSLKGDGKPVSFIEDCAVPLEHLAEYTDALPRCSASTAPRAPGTRTPRWARCTCGPSWTCGATRARDARIAEEASALVRKYKGAYSGEHGDGLCRGEWIRWQFGPAIDSAFGEIKRMFDPLQLLSPKRIIDPPRMDDTRLMRFPPSYKVIPLQPALDWSAWDVQNDPATEQTTAPGTGGDPARGFAKAVEMRNNNGHCRKFDAGTMCPSYRVTRDEQHLTRGRANTLRLAVSGQPGPDGLVSDAVREALELCVSCKGCKRDCPTGVDMARMKIEFRHADGRKNGWSLKDRLVAKLPDYAATASRFAGLLNLRNKSGLLAALGERLLGFSAQRSCCPSGKAAISSTAASPAPRASKCWPPRNPWCCSSIPSTASSNRPTPRRRSRCCRRRATRCTSPASKADGKHLCCGRTYLSSGMVDEAKAKATELLDALHPLAAGASPSSAWSRRACCPCATR